MVLLDEIERLGIRLRYHRERVGLSLREFGRRAQYNHSIVSRVERGLMTAPASLLDAYEDILDLTVDGEFVERRTTLMLGIEMRLGPAGIDWLDLVWSGSAGDSVFQPLMYFAPFFPNARGAHPEVTFAVQEGAFGRHGSVSPVADVLVRRRPVAAPYLLAGRTLYELRSPAVEPRVRFANRCRIDFETAPPRIGFCLSHDIRLSQLTITCWSKDGQGAALRIGRAAEFPGDSHLINWFLTSERELPNLLDGDESFRVTNGPLNYLTEWTDFEIISTDKRRRSSLPILRVREDGNSGQEWVEVENNVWRNKQGTQQGETRP